MEFKFVPNKFWMCSMDNPMVRWTQNQKVRHIIVERGNKWINMVDLLYPRTVILRNLLATDLTTMSIKTFEIITNGAIQPPDFDNRRFQYNASSLIGPVCILKYSFVHGLDDICVLFL